jgi:hypothetical protein
VELEERVKRISGEEFCIEVDWLKRMARGSVEKYLTLPSFPFLPPLPLQTKPLHTFPSGTAYCGQWRDSQMCGNGTAVTDNG